MVLRPTQRFLIANELTPRQFMSDTYCSEIYINDFHLYFPVSNRIYFNPYFVNTIAENYFYLHGVLSNLAYLPGMTRDIPGVFRYSDLWELMDVECVLEIQLHPDGQVKMCELREASEYAYNLIDHNGLPHEEGLEFIADTVNPHIHQLVEHRLSPDKKLDLLSDFVSDPVNKLYVSLLDAEGPAENEIFFSPRPKW